MESGARIKRRSRQAEGSQIMDVDIDVNEVINKLITRIGELELEKSLLEVRCQMLASEKSNTSKDDSEKSK